MFWKKQISSSPCYERLSSSRCEKWSSSGSIRKGHVPLMVGEEDDHVRFMVPAKLMKHPSMAHLLQRSADEFGFDQQGVLRIPCDPQRFRDIVANISQKKL